MILRLVLVFALSGLVVGASLALRRWRAGLHGPVDLGGPGQPTVPLDLVSGAERTWLVFTTPYCASCGPVVERLRRADPDARVVTVDAAAKPSLAAAFNVRSAPTVLLAGTDGEVQARLVGAGAVYDYVGDQLSASRR